jgi:hypothetical protein
MAVTFPVSPEVDLGPPLPAVDHREVLDLALPGPIEALWKPARPLVACPDSHVLIATISRAFFEHYPLVLTPDAVWLTLARGFALHVVQNAESLRHRFVGHEGKLKLVVDRPDFRFGRDNPWPEAFEAFSDQIAGHVGKLRQFVRCDFSTTGPVERAVADLMVMETFEPYFEYEMMMGCGIPLITLEGTPADWKSIRDRAALFGEFGLETWSRALDPILAQFVAAAEGRADATFWRSTYRYLSSSGRSEMTGWITVLFPYIEKRRGRFEPNSCLAGWERRFRESEPQAWRRDVDNLPGISAGIPNCQTSVPLKLKWPAGECRMRLIGGLMGISQDPTSRAVRPECGWAVTYDIEEPTPENLEFLARAPDGGPASLCAAWLQRKTSASEGDSEFVDRGPDQ